MADLNLLPETDRPQLNEWTLSSLRLQLKIAEKMINSAPPKSPYQQRYSGPYLGYPTHPDE